MPEDALSVVRSGFEAYFRGDEAGLLELMDEDVVVTQLPEQPDSGVYHGREGARRATSQWIDSWDDYSIEVLDMREVAGRALVTFQQRGRGKGSGAEMSARTYFLFTVQDDRITRWQMFSSEEQALAAAEERE